MLEVHRLEVHLHATEGRFPEIYRVAKKNNTETNQNDTDTNDIFGH